MIGRAEAAAGIALAGMLRRIAARDGELVLSRPDVLRLAEAAERVELQRLDAEAAMEAAAAKLRLEAVAVMLQTAEARAEVLAAVEARIRHAARWAAVIAAPLILWMVS